MSRIQSAGPGLALAALVLSALVAGCSQKPSEPKPAADAAPAQKAPVAVKMTKHLVQRGQDLDLANANALEADVFGLLCSTDDRHEGMQAFLEKRPAKFTAR